MKKLRNGEYVQVDATDLRHLATSQTPKMTAQFIAAPSAVIAMTASSQRESIELEKLEKF
jgi:DNA-nicking Smr family endonuclease